MADKDFELEVQADIAASEKKPRRLFSWRDDLPVYPMRSAPNYRTAVRDYYDDCFVDDLCRKICSSPSMRALAKLVPGVMSTEIYGGYRDEVTSGIYFIDNTMFLNLKTLGRETKENVFDRLTVTLPHEYRHTFQNAAACLDCLDDDAVRDELRDQIFFVRTMEADATVFSIAVAYELWQFEQDRAPLEQAYFDKQASIDAYVDMTQRNAGTHWDGKASSTAFYNYFTKDNRNTLDSYDKALCDVFEERAKTGRGFREPLSRRSREKIIWDYVEPIRHMPYLSYDGQIKHRENYLARYDKKAVMKHLAGETKESIRQMALI